MDFISEINRVWPLLSVATTVFSVLATLLAGFCLYHLHQRFVPRGDHEALAAEHAGHDERIGELERRMQNVPTSQDMHRLQLSIEEIRGDHKAMRAQLDGMKDSIEAIGNNVTMLVQSHMKE